MKVTSLFFRATTPTIHMTLSLARAAGSRSLARAAAVRSTCPRPACPLPMGASVSRPRGVTQQQQRAVSASASPPDAAEAFQSSQQAAPRPTLAEEARTLVQCAR